MFQIKKSVIVSGPLKFRRGAFALVRKEAYTFRLSCRIPLAPFGPKGFFHYLHSKQTLRRTSELTSLAVVA